MQKIISKIQGTLFPVFYLLLSITLAQPYSRSDLAKDELHGPVQTVKFPKTSTPGSGDGISTYNEQGLLTQWVTSSGQGKEYKGINTYDSQGRLVEKLLYQNGILTQRTTHTYEGDKWIETFDYDGENNIVNRNIRAENITDIPEDRNYQLGVFWFDERECRESQLGVTANDPRPLEKILEDRPHYTCDKAGHIIEEYKIEPDGKKVVLRTYLYNQKGLLEEEKAFDYLMGDGTTFTKTIYTYDTNGNPLTETSYNNAINVRNLLEWLWDPYAAAATGNGIYVSDQDLAGPYDLVTKRATSVASGLQKYSGGLT